MTSYELQIFVDSRWRITATEDDRTQAILDAKRMVARGRYLAVRVIESNFDLATYEFTSKTVFRDSRMTKSPFSTAIELHRETGINHRNRARGARSFNNSASIEGTWPVDHLALVGVLVSGAATLAALEWLKTLVF